MGLIVNKTVNLGTGQSLATGWYINCKSPFRDGDSGDSNNMPIKIYKSKADKDAGKKPLQVDEVDLQKNHRTDITVTEINTDGWFVAYYGKLKTVIGANNNLGFIESDIADDI